MTMLDMGAPSGSSRLAILVNLRATGFREVAIVERRGVAVALYAGLKQCE